jgi:hypothetical protein
LRFVAALAALDAERGDPDANILDFGDALWWAITTMTTVGYGDRYPVTTTGRIVAGGLMVGGIALLGTVTATLASLLIERVADESQACEPRWPSYARRFHDWWSKYGASRATVLVRNLEPRRLRLSVCTGRAQVEVNRCEPARGVDAGG